MRWGKEGRDVQVSYVEERLVQGHSSPRKERFKVQWTFTEHPLNAEKHAKCWNGPEIRSTLAFPQLHTGCPWTPHWLSLSSTLTVLHLHTNCASIPYCPSVRATLPSLSSFSHLCADCPSATYNGKTEVGGWRTGRPGLYCLFIRKVKIISRISATTVYACSPFWTLHTWPLPSLCRNLTMTLGSGLLRFDWILNWFFS
jgi:hypothetical protein